MVHESSDRLNCTHATARTLRLVHAHRACMQCTQCTQCSRLATMRCVPPVLHSCEPALRTQCSTGIARSARTQRMHAYALVYCRPPSVWHRAMSCSEGTCHDDPIEPPPRSPPMKDQSGVLSAAFAVIAIVGARVDVHDALGKVAVLSEVRVKPVCVVVTAARDHRTQNAYSEPSETRRCMRPMHTTYAADPKANQRRRTSARQK